MSSHTSKSSRLLALWTLVPLALFCIPAFADEVAESKLVVHEWGVLTVGHTGGSSVLGAADRYLESLPKFVIRNDIQSASEQLHARQLTVWKPVIHFYGDEGQKVEVTVTVAGGYPVVYFPNPKLGAFSTNDGRSPLTWSQSMTWNFSLTEKRPASLLTPPAEHWWNAARNIPSDYVLMEGKSGSERFLFYEGTTNELPRITAIVSEKSIAITNAHTEKSAPVILILNDQGIRSGIYLDPIPPGTKVSLDSDSFTPWDEKTLLTHCQNQWQTCGMTPEESAGIVESWKPELLNTPGFLLISRIPEPVYETMFPIKIKPAPSELNRACLVFDTLAGQNARKHWVPELATESESLIAQLSNPDFKARVGAREKLVAHGEIVAPFLQDLIARSDAELEAKMFATIIIGLLTESPVCKIPEPDLSLGRLHGLEWKRH